MSRRIVSAWDRRMADFDGTGPIEKEINRKIDHGGESPKIHPQEMAGVIWPEHQPSSRKVGFFRLLNAIGSQPVVYEGKALR